MEDIFQPKTWVEPYTYSRKIITAVMNGVLPNRTFAVFATELRQIGKTTTHDALVNARYVMPTDGVDVKNDKKIAAEYMTPCDDGQTIWQTNPVYSIALYVNDPRLDNIQLYLSLESLSDHALGDAGKGAHGQIFSNNELKCRMGEVGEALSASRVNAYTIVGMGDKWWSSTRCEWRYYDYDIVPNLQFKDDMQKKGVVKFEKADYVKNAADAGVSLGLYIFMSTFDTFVLKKGGQEEMMTGLKMATELILKHDCFKFLLAGGSGKNGKAAENKGPQFEKAKFDEWLINNGKKMTPNGVNPAMYQLDGGDTLGKMIIYRKYPGGSVTKDTFSLKLKI